MELSALLYLLCSSKSLKIDFLELGFRNWGCALLKINLVMSLYTCCSGGRYAVLVKSIRRIGVWLGVGTTFDILNPSRIYVQIVDTAYWVSPYGVLHIISLRLIHESWYGVLSQVIRRIGLQTCQDGFRCWIRRILLGNTAYWSFRDQTLSITSDFFR